MSDQVTLYLSSSPHIASPVTARRLMTRVIIALAPVSVFGIFLYGIPALLTILVSVAAAELAEFLFRKAAGRDIRNADLSAAVTGLLLALILPPGTPLWITALGSAFAIVVAKEFFGGLGANVFNPALIGRAFLLMSFPAAITSWDKPRAFFAPVVDAITTATPLGIIKAGQSVADVGAGFAASGLASSADYGHTLLTLFLGLRSGSIGESSIILILIGFVYLLVIKTIDWRAPLTMTASVFILSFLFERDPLFAVLSGGALFGAVFMATDYVSAPLTSIGKLIFGAGAGLITVLIRQWGNYPEGVTYSILIMNALVPFLNKLLQRKYGWTKPMKAAETPAKEAAK